eukprot:8984-Chlamydomonas_euryale.AAC.1
MLYDILATERRGWRVRHHPLQAMVAIGGAYGGPRPRQHRVTATAWPRRRRIGQQRLPVASALGTGCLAGRALVIARWRHLYILTQRGRPVGRPVFEKRIRAPVED